MKCPKCQYISFESGARCRNCGYEFSLTAQDLDALDLDGLDLRMQTGNEPLGPLADFDLSEQDGPKRPFPSAPASGSGTRVATASAELPLFRDRILPDDVPLVAPPTVPRAPLSVRRSTPTLVRDRSRAPVPEEPTFDLESPDDFPSRVSPSERVVLPAAEAGGPWTLGVANPIAAPARAPARLAAALIDWLILGAIDVAILYFTLRLTRLGFQDLRLLPPVPVAGFLLLINGGYFVLFTAAGGQTIGKMLTGIRVVPADPPGLTRGRVPLAHAVIRVAGYAASLLPLGLGYLPALIGQERRAIHDRLADTRVIQA